MASFFDPIDVGGGGGSSGPTNAQILAGLRPWDGSGTGVFAKVQAKAAIKSIQGLNFSDAEIDEMLTILEATAGGTIRIETLAQHVAFEAAKKLRHGSPQQTQAREAANGLSINVFDEAGQATSPQEDRPPSPSYSGSLNSPGTVMGVPEWYGASIADRELSPAPGGQNPFPRSISADPFQTSSTNDDIFGLFPTETKDDIHVQKSSSTGNQQAVSGAGIGLIAPPRQKSQPGSAPTDQTNSIGWGRQGSVDTHGKKKKKRRKKKKAGSRETTPDPDGGVEMTPGPDDVDPTPEPGQAGEGAAGGEDDGKEQQQQRVDALSEMKRGTAMLKYGRRGFPHFRRFQISSDNARLLWFSKKKATADTSVLIQDIVDVKEGQQTEVFKQCTQPALERASFSIIYGTTYKTLDVVAKSREEAQMWVKGIRVLAQAARNGTLDSVDEIPVMVNFTDITKPRYREQMGGKKKAVGPYNNPELTRVIQRNLDQCKQRYQALVQMTNTDQIRNSDEFENVSTLLVEMEERLEDVQLGLTQKSAPLSSLKRDTWVIKVDITVLEEKVKVINRGG